MGNQFKDFENITLETFKNRYSSLTELLNAVIADPYGAILAYEIQKLLYNVILQKLKQLGYPLRPAAALLGHAIMLAAAKIPSLSEKNTKGYSYVSESGSPMVGCISFLSRPRYVHQAALAVAKECGFPTEFKIRDIAKFNREFNNFAIKFDSSSPKVAEAPEVVFLGNSSRPVLTKRRFIEALEEGLSIEQIKEKFRGWSAKPLAQWKAHHTMGTYDMTRQDEQETITVKCDGKDVERINKDEALELLSAGIPPKEIFDAYPTSFTVGQLRAFKAHYSMGTYIIDQT